MHAKQNGKTVETTHTSDPSISIFITTDGMLIPSASSSSAVNATFGHQAVKPGSIVASALADGPGWIMDKLWVPTDTSPVVKQRWISYLQQQGMTPALLGASTWAAVRPYRTRAAVGRLRLRVEQLDASHLPEVPNAHRMVGAK